MRTADAVGAEALLDLFNRAYADYFLPIRLELPQLLALVESCDLDLSASPVEDGIGFCLLGVRGGDGWIGGMGVVPAARRGGRGRVLLEAAVERARRRGVSTLRLEVLEQNEPARRLYEALGFEHVRDLDVWSLSAEHAFPEDAAAVEVDDAHDWIRRRRVEREPWQRDDATLAHARDRLAALELRRGGDRVGAVVRDGAAIVQLAAADDEAVRRLVEAVLADAGAVRWLNVPAASAGSRAMEALGAMRVAVQHELALRL